MTKWFREANTSPGCKIRHKLNSRITSHFDARSVRELNSELRANFTRLKPDDAPHFGVGASPTRGTRKGAWKGAPTHMSEGQDQDFATTHKLIKMRARTLTTVHWGSRSGSHRPVIRRCGQACRNGFQSRDRERIGVATRLEVILQRWQRQQIGVMKH